MARSTLRKIFTRAGIFPTGRVTTGVQGCRRAVRSRGGWAKLVASHVLNELLGMSAVPVTASVSLRNPVVDASPVFIAKALTKVYEMGEVRVDALRGVDFNLARGELVVLLGPSGSGKSTLLNILGGLDVPTAGEVIYEGQNLTTADDAALTEYRRNHIGFVFQFYNLIPA
jgi:ABC-type glutathione transport system ATPase component